GSVHEDFAIESMAGDIFQLGNTSYRILRVERSKLRVEDAHGLPPSIPFWIAEAPGRSDELSIGVSRLRSEVEARLAGEPAPPRTAPESTSVGSGFSRDASAFPVPPKEIEASPPGADKWLKPLPAEIGDGIAAACRWL